MEMSNKYILNPINEYLKGSTTTEDLEILQNWNRGNSKIKFNYYEYVDLILSQPGLINLNKR
jgi:hypothetical protein